MVDIRILYNSLTLSMITEITVLEFKLSITFSEYCTHKKAPEQQAMFKEMGVKIFYMGEFIGES
tara:strand:+ start:302 stop:493 length:192 start_codon:yes stop_codon:yes gene_type:complete